MPKICLDRYVEENDVAPHRATYVPTQEYCQEAIVVRISKKKKKKRKRKLAQVVRVHM